MTFYVTSPNFHVLSVIINFLLAKNHRENILKRTISAVVQKLWSKTYLCKMVVKLKHLVYISCTNHSICFFLKFIQRPWHMLPYIVTNILWQVSSQELRYGAKRDLLWMSRSSEKVSNILPCKPYPTRAWVYMWSSIEILLLIFQGKV